MKKNKLYEGRAVRTSMASHRRHRSLNEAQLTGRRTQLCTLGKEKLSISHNSQKEKVKIDFLFFQRSSRFILFARCSVAFRRLLLGRWLVLRASVAPPSY